MSSLSEAFDDKRFQERIKQKLPRLFQIAEIECSRAGKIGMEVGSTREKILIALLIDYFGEDRVETKIAITEPEIDVRVDSYPISIKTITGRGGVKVSWTVDAESAEDFYSEYSPSCGILFVRINWGMKESNRSSGLFWIPLEVQERVLQRLGKDRYLKLPKPGTNPRGIELRRGGLENLLVEEGTKHIDIDWQRKAIEYDPYERWVKYWREK